MFVLWGQTCPVQIACSSWQKPYVDHTLMWIRRLKVKSLQTERIQFSATRECGGTSAIILTLVVVKRTCLLLWLTFSLHQFSVSFFYQSSFSLYGQWSRIGNIFSTVHCDYFFPSLWLELPLLVNVLEKHVRSVIAFYLLRLKTLITLCFNCQGKVLLHMLCTNYCGNSCTANDCCNDCHDRTDERWEKVSTDH